MYGNGNAEWGEAIEGARRIIGPLVLTGSGWRASLRNSGRSDGIGQRRERHASILLTSKALRHAAVTSFSLALRIQWCADPQDSFD